MSARRCLATLVASIFSVALMSASAAAARDDEPWNAYGQLTYITSFKPRFAAAYTNANGTPNSLLPDAERSWTATATLYAGAHLWPGGDVYFVPELIAERPLSDLRGLGGAIQNFELQKRGGATPVIYRSRAYLEQTFNL